MKKSLRCLMSAMLFLCMFIGILAPAITARADANDFTAELKVGYDGKAEIGKYAPFSVTIENNGSDFAGRLQVIVGNKVGYNILHESDFSIGRGEKKTVNFACKVVDNFGKANIRLVTKKEKVVWAEEKRFSVDKSALQKIDIGILSDDFSALGYMDNVEFYDRETFKTNLMELSADTFPEDVNALDMMEVIVISNFSTDILTDEQLEALYLWVNRGGFLIIGTGSNSSKTLSKLNGHIIDVKPKKMNQYQTSFGLNWYGDLTRTANSQIENSQPNTGYDIYNADPYSDDEFMESFNEYYENAREEVDSECLEDFKANLGLSDDDMNEDGTVPDYMEDIYRTFCMEYFYSFWVQQPDINSNQNQNYYYETVAADVLNFDEDEAEEIMGDSTAGDYVLGRVYSAAEGYIAVYGVDFTMNPLPRYNGADGLIRYLILRYVMEDVLEDYDAAANMNNSYYGFNIGSSAYNNSYYIRDFTEKIASAPVPPLLFYILPIVGYLVAVMVLYFVSRKKKKTFRLWYWYPVLAVGVAVITFSIGFSTRIIKPRINCMTLLDLNAPVTLEKNFVAVTTPSNKNCEVGFSDEYDIQMIREINRYSHDNSDHVDLNSYRIGFRKDVDQTYVRFSNNVALSSNQFMLESAYTDSKSFDAQYDVNSGQLNHAQNLILTNNTGLDLENAVVIAPNPGSTSTSGHVDFRVFRIGDWKKGQVIDMTNKVFRSGDNCGDYAAIAFTSEDEHTLSSFFFGSLSEGFSQYMNRKNFLEYILNKVENEANSSINGGSVPNYNPSNQVYVVGFVKDGGAKALQGTDKYRLERTELLMQRFDVEKIPQVVKK